MNGPFQVGYKVVYTSQNSNRVAMYYPMDKSEYNSQITNLDLLPNWINYGEKQLEWMAKCSLWKQGRLTSEKTQSCKQFLDIKIPVISNGLLA